MLIIKNPMFHDPWGGESLPVIELIGGNIKSLDTEHFYLVDGYVYKFIPNASVKDIKPGVIVEIGGRYLIEPHNETSGEGYQKDRIVSDIDFDSRTSDEKSLEDMYSDYIENYRSSNNIIKSGNIKITPIGDVYMPDLEPTDDSLEIIIKLMLRHLKPIMNEHRGAFDKKHGLDNIKSALNGATKNMSVTKFIKWCESFDLDWEITLHNSSADVMNPLSTPIELSSLQPLPYEDIPIETKNCFTVPLVPHDDPLKWAVKLALNQKRVDLKDYKDRSPSQHTLNNMKAALKVSTQKMSLKYFVYWCEIIDMVYSFKVTSRTDGIWYKINGYDVSTNDKEME